MLTLEIAVTLITLAALSVVTYFCGIGGFGRNHPKI